jgi:aminoglycoside phosphotransferase (APT) family kinase protein
MMAHATLDDSVESLRQVLADYIAEHSGSPAVRVENLHRVGGGSSRENWPFDLSGSEDAGDKWQALLLRRDPTESVVTSDRTVEFNLLRALEPTPIPSPAVLWLDELGRSFGRPSMIMARSPGEASRALLRDRDPLALGPEGRLRLARELCTLLAELHALDIEATGIGKIVPAPAVSPAAGELASWTSELDRQELDPEPRLRMVATWLAENLPQAPSRLVLVHGDYRPANVLVHDGRIEALLDWELARLGDPLDDLGWYTTPLYRREHFIEGSWETDDFLDLYERTTGSAVDRDALKFWQVMAIFRLAVIALTSVRSFLDGASDRPTAPIRQLTAQALATAIG